MTTAIQALDVDLQLMILDVLSQTSARSLLNVFLSSRSLYRLSRRFIYRIIHFTFNRSRREVNGRLIKQLQNDDDLSANVREIRILWAPSAKLQPGEGSKEDLERLGQVLPKFAGLKTFIWDAQYPILSWLLGTLRKHHPQCYLYNRHPASQDSAQTLPRLRELPSLFSLDVTLTDGQYLAFSELQRILISSSNLKDLTFACSHSMILDSDIKHPALELRSLELYGRPLNLAPLPVMWHMLERLSMDSIALIPDLASQLTGLKTLRICVDGDLENIHLAKFLRRCTRLESLDLTGFTWFVQRSSEDFWQNVGQSLIRLRLHDDVARGTEGDRHVLSTDDLKRIVKYCCNLRSLGLDVQCYGQEWPYTMLKYIANEFWFIIHLELNILIESPQHDRPSSPKATLDNVPEIWSYLWQQIQSSRVRKCHTITIPRLRSLDLIAGSKMPDSDWQADQQRFNFDLAERDDEARLGIAKVKCTELEALLSKLSPAAPMWNHQQELIMNIATERARKGPLIQMPSVMDNEMVRPSPFWDRRDAERFYYR